jgi:glycosyltransferase involved in cell wall biosynthesis
MRILQVNKFFWQKAGPERYMLELAELLARRGHDLSFFAMQHERNLPSDCSPHFVSRIEYRNTSPWYKLCSAVRTVGKTVYSFESRRKIRGLIAQRKPEIAHLHVISRHISPSILPELRRSGVPIVQTVHNAELVCPAAHLFIEHRQEICNRCLGGGYYHAVLNRCVHGSRAASLLSGAAQYVHRASGVFEKNVALFICPSQFLAKKLADGGIPESKIRILPNYINLDSYSPAAETGRYGVFLGRLSPEKGLPTLLAAAAIARSVPLVIVGEGPQRESLERQAATQGLSQVTFTGHKLDAELREIVRGAAFLVLPSECYENCPMVVFEAGGMARPVIASDIGGVPELIHDDDNGLLFSPGDAAQLAEMMLRLFADARLCAEMGRRNRERVECLCQDHYERLMALYQEARQ